MHQIITMKARQKMILITIGSFFFTPHAPAVAGKPFSGNLTWISQILPL